MDKHVRRPTFLFLSLLLLFPLALPLPVAAQEAADPDRAETADPAKAPDQIKALIQRFYQAWNEQDFVVAEDLVADVFIQFDLNNRREPQTWGLEKIQPRDAFLDGIVGEWTGPDGRDYDPDIHKYTKEVEFYDIQIRDGLALAIVGERRVGPDGPHGDWQHNAWLTQRLDGVWKIAGTLDQVPVAYETARLKASSGSVRLRLFADGSDKVYLDSAGVWIEHIADELPGRHRDGDGFSPVYINDQPWQPVWQGDRTRKVLFEIPLEIPAGSHFSLTRHAARDIAQIEDEPAAPGQPVSVLIADEEDGAAWYDVEVHWAATAPGSGADLPKPTPPGRDDLLLEVLFSGEIRDSSPHSRPLKNTKVVLTENRHGAAKRAGYFDGKAAVGIEGFPLDGPFSLSIWTKYDEVEHRSFWWNNCIWAQDDGGNTRVFQLSTLGRRFTWHRMRDEDLHSKLFLKADRWYHLVAVYDGDYHRLFVDGVLQEHKQSTVNVSPDQPIYIGAKNLDETGFFFTGALDDARLYGRVLTTAEISALYQGMDQ